MYLQIAFFKEMTYQPELAACNDIVPSAKESGNAS